MIAPNYASYRDPAARVVKKPDGWYRYVFKAYQKEFDYLMQSGLYAELVQKDLMIGHEEVEIDSDDPAIYKMIRPGQIAFQSYPFEWSYNQWRKALIALLDINSIALKYGMILKDATPYNFYLNKGKAVLLDTTSFVLFTPNDPWVAYRQFCEEFLGPVALMRYNGAEWAKLTMAAVRGLGLPFISRQLPKASRLSSACLLHIHLHARYTGKKGKAKKGFTAEKLLSLFAMLRSSVNAWDIPYRHNGHWDDYYDQGDVPYIISKERILIRWLSEIRPDSVIDLGTNTGRFAFLAAKHAKRVIGVDFDEHCIDVAEHAIEKESLANITVLSADLAQPSPGLGVMNKEYPPLLERGQSDLALALALVHHLCIDMNISLAQVAEMVAALSEKYAIVEFVPEADDRAAQLIANRGGVFTGYSEELFITALSAYFDQVEEVEVSPTKRKLYLFKKRQ
ncbi:MAG: class I SAM-dependent methyltransferase [Bacteroidetes bacterium]|nr:class I SAM-dependent methyltransferase [Bacteroidota bacterium]